MLHLSNKIRDLDELRMVLDSLKVNTDLKILDLSKNKLGEEGALVVRNKLGPNRSVEELDLGYNEIGDVGMLAMSELLMTGNLKRINLYGNNFGYKGAAIISAVLKYHTSLSVLDIGENNIGDEGAIALSEGLKVNTGLSTLAIYDNNIGDLGIIAISSAMQTQKSLRMLIASGNKIGDEGAIQLSKVISSLESLDLADNQIGDKGATKIGEGLGETKPYMLCLSGNLFGTDVGNKIRGKWRVRDEEYLILYKRSYLAECSGRIMEIRVTPEEEEAEKELLKKIMESR